MSFPQSLPRLQSRRPTLPLSGPHHPGIPKADPGGQRSGTRAQVPVEMAAAAGRQTGEQPVDMDVGLKPRPRLRNNSQQMATRTPGTSADPRAAIRTPLCLFEHVGLCLQPRPDVALRSRLNRHLAHRDLYERGLPWCKTLVQNAMPFTRHRSPFTRQQAAACYLEPHSWFAQSGGYAAATGMETDQ
jgi:hypothetical protein